MIIDPQLAENFQESVEQLESNVRYFASQFVGQSSTMRIFFKKEILNKFADIHFYLGKLIGRIPEEEQFENTGFSITESEQTGFYVIDSSLKPEPKTQTSSSNWTIKDPLTDVLSEHESQSAEQVSGLLKRGPQLLSGLFRDEPSRLLESNFDSEPETDYKLETPKRRGRVLLSSELENHLLESIKAQWRGSREQPTRRWINNLARNFIDTHHLGMKCSKGWLDKFIRRNKHMF
jgi:hypothetical protein